MDIINELEEFLLTEIILDLGPGIRSIAPDEDLIDQGILDSLGIIKMAYFLEEKFGIKIKDEDINQENFRTLDCLKKMIEAKQKIIKKEPK